LKKKLYFIFRDIGEVKRESLYDLGISGWQFKRENLAGINFTRKKNLQPFKI
jgi:hypothetical protein